MATIRQNARRTEVLDLLHRRGSDGATARYVSEALGIHYTTANDDLHILQNAGQITSEGGPAFGTARSWRAV